MLYPWYQRVKANLPKSRMSLRISSPFFLLQLTFNNGVLVQSLCRVWLWPHGLQHLRLLCPPLSHGICSKSCPLSRWCHLITISSATAFSFYLHSFPASASFPMSCLFSSGSRSTEGSISTSVLPTSIQDWSPLGWTALNTFQSKRLSRVFSSTTFWNYPFFRTQAFFMAQLSHPYMTTGKTMTLTIWTFVGKVMSLLFKHCLGLS